MTWLEIIDKYIPVIGAFLCVLTGVILTKWLGRTPKDAVADFMAIARSDSVRNALELSKKSGDKQIAILNSGKMILILEVFEVGTLFSSIAFQLRNPPEDDPEPTGNTDQFGNPRTHLTNGTAIVRHSEFAFLSVPAGGEAFVGEREKNAEKHKRECPHNKCRFFCVG